MSSPNTWFIYRSVYMDISYVVNTASDYTYTYTKLAALLLRVGGT